VNLNLDTLDLKLEIATTVYYQFEMSLCPIAPGHWRQLIRVLNDTRVKES